MDRIDDIPIVLPSDSAVAKAFVKISTRLLSDIRRALKGPTNSRLTLDRCADLPTVVADLVTEFAAVKAENLRLVTQNSFLVAKIADLRSRAE